MLTIALHNKAEVINLPYSCHINVELDHQDQRLFIDGIYIYLYPFSWAYQRHCQCNICHAALQKM